MTASRQDRSKSPEWPIHLGCPVWACPHWAGKVYPARTPRKDWLAWYSSTFNTVEGNSTFYALPSIETAKRWASQVATGFKFCLKFPREISHELQLVGATGATETFLRVIEPLAEANCLGPTFLQLSPGFGPDRFETLASYLKSLPQDMKWAVELRHFDWFDQGDNEHRINDLLSDMQIDKVLFDSRPLYQSPPDDEIERASQGRKPRTPIRQTVTGQHPFLRIVGRNKIEMTDRFLDQWSPIIEKWVCDGLRPTIFTHAPDDTFAPAFARRFATRLQEQPGIGSFEIPKPAQPPQQLSLLD